ncbi:MAG TPA: fumarylacetoacetate hydrolase family protein [Rhodocyclaceae bacterium]|nr:fumarylacetoacetate hydrolase family protein [Rhodocyclaceae bacterium]
MSSTWVRFADAGSAAYGRVEGGTVTRCRGSLFDRGEPLGEPLPLADVRLLTPCVPGKFIGLWNNFQARAAHEGWARPEHPLYFVKTDNCYAAPGDAIVRPRHYDGPVVFEGELGIVIGRTCRDIDVADADQYIFGYTCVNDVTARAILKSDPSFPQWSRAKSFDTFGPFGPQIVSGLDPDTLRVVTRVNGVVLQDYPVSDMFFRPREIVARLSRDMTLSPGDLIACGTSLGAGPLVSGDVVEVEIAGVGTLSNSVA